MHIAVDGSDRICPRGLYVLGLLSCATIAACVDLTPPWDRAPDAARGNVGADSQVVPSYSDGVLAEDAAGDAESKGFDAPDGGVFPDTASPTTDGMVRDEGAGADGKAGDSARPDGSYPDVPIGAGDTPALDVPVETVPDELPADLGGAKDANANKDGSESLTTKDSNEAHDSDRVSPADSEAMVKLTGTAFGTGPAYSGSPTATYDRAFDGDITTFFDDSHGSGGYTGIALGDASAAVAIIRFYPRLNFNDRMVGGKFQCSLSSQTDGYVDLYTVAMVPPLAWTEVRVVDAPPCRFFRYLAPDNSYSNVAEIEFWAKVSVDGGLGPADAGAPLTNLSLGKSVRASSERTSVGMSAVMGNDGLLSTQFCPASNEFPVWYEVDLGAIYPIRQTDLTVEISYTTCQYRIEISTDDSSWTALANHESDAVFGPATRTDSFEATARFVRLTIVGVAGGYWGCFKEFTVWGAIPP